MEITIQINGQAVSVEVSVEVYTYLDQANHKDENLAHEQRRHWDMRELDEYVIANGKQILLDILPIKTGCIRKYSQCVRK